MRIKYPNMRVFFITLFLVVVFTENALAETVRCVLVVPHGEVAYPDAQERLTAILKDVQWWYSCQMEAHGYGAKTFPLEMDPEGMVRIHIAHVGKSLPEGDPNTARKMCLDAAAASLRAVRKPDDVMVVVVSGYVWADKANWRVNALGTGKGGKYAWAFLTGWHYYGANPTAWQSSIRLCDTEDMDTAGFPDHYLRVLKATYGQPTAPDYKKARLKWPLSHHAAGRALFAHEIGHAFGLQHWQQGQPKVNPSIMGGGYHAMRGNFCEDITGAWCSLTALDAAKLDRSAMFRVIPVEPPSSKAARSVGMRGAKEALQAAGEFAAKTISKQTLNDVPTEGNYVLSELAGRIVGVWASGAKTENMITFHRNGTVTASYDNDASRRWKQEVKRLVFTKGDAQQEIVFFAEGRAMRMGNNVWIKVPSPNK